MKTRPVFLTALLWAALLLTPGKPLAAGTITFEGLLDSTPVTTQYSGVTFTNATVLTAGISLNELEFPPHSGSNVVFDDSGPMALSFASPSASFSGYFTYTSALTLTFYGTGGSVLGSVNSTWSNNSALSGVAGSSPNQLLSYSNAAGIASVRIQGDPAGGSFVADDITFRAASSSVPEPVTFPLITLCLVGLFAIRRLA